MEATIDDGMLERRFTGAPAGERGEKGDISGQGARKDLEETKQAIFSGSMTVDMLYMDTIMGGLCY